MEAPTNFIMRKFAVWMHSSVHVTVNISNKVNCWQMNLVLWDLLQQSTILIPCCFICQVWGWPRSRFFKCL